MQNIEIEFNLRIMGSERYYIARTISYKAIIYLGIGHDEIIQITVGGTIKIFETNSISSQMRQWSSAIVLKGVIIKLHIRWNYLVHFL